MKLMRIEDIYINVDKIAYVEFDKLAIGIKIYFSSMEIERTPSAKATFPTAKTEKVDFITLYGPSALAAAKFFEEYAGTETVVPGTDLYNLEADNNQA